MEIRAETPSDYPAIFEVNTLAFGQDNEARLVEAIRASDRYIPQLSLVAAIDDRIVGHILFSYVDLIGEATWQALALAPIAVHPEFQRQRIGSALIQAGLAIADEMEETIVILLGHPEFYPRFGFEPSVRYNIQAPFPVPEEAFMVKPLKKYEEKYQGKVTYPPAFDGV